MTTRALRRAAPGLLAVSLAAACSSIKVTQDFTPGTDFTPYRTFAVMPRDRLADRFGAPTASPELLQHLEDALARELARRGLRPAGDAPPDLAVAYRATLRRALDESTYGRTYTWSGPSASPDPITREVDEGTLLVDLVDARTGKLVWRGGGKGVPDPRRLDALVAAIVEQYPPAGR